MERNLRTDIGTYCYCLCAPRRYGHITMTLSANLGSKSHRRPALSAAAVQNIHKYLFILEFFVFSLLSILPSTSHAQLIDTVDVQRRSANEAEVIIRFAAQVQYLRHAPRDAGRSVHIYIALTGAGVQPGDLVPQTLRLPKQDFMPQIAVSFPEPGNSVLVSFDQNVRFSVNPGSDGRSIRLLVNTGSGG